MFNIMLFLQHIEGPHWPDIGDLPSVVTAAQDAEVYELIHREIGCI